MAIRGKKPQAYNAKTKQNEEVFWRASSIDFDDEKSLAEKYRDLLDTVNQLKRKNQELEELLLAPIPVPKQQGVIVYNGKIQAPNWTLDSSRITISGDVNGINSGEYMAYANLQEGFTWEDGTTARKELTWRIYPGYVRAEPYFDGLIVANGRVQSAKNYLHNFYETDFILSGALNFKDPGKYEIGIEPTYNVTWLDGTKNMRTLEYTVYSYEDFVNASIETINGARIQELTDEFETIRTDFDALSEQTEQDMTQCKADVKINRDAIVNLTGAIKSHDTLIDTQNTVLSAQSDKIQANTDLINETIREYLNSDHILAEAISEALYQIKVIKATGVFHDIPEEELAAITKDDILQGSGDTTESITNTMDDYIAQLLQAMEDKFKEG